MKCVIQHKNRQVGRKFRHGFYMLVKNQFLILSIKRFFCLLKSACALELCKTPPCETANVVYKFQCTCKDCSAYIGQTELPLIERIKQHNQYCHARGIYFHIQECEIYKRKLESLLNENGNPSPNSDKHHELEIDFLKSHFTVLEKNFATYFERMDAEAYFIRSHRPKLNEQKQHRYFSLY